MLFHTPKLPAEIRISHLNARVNEQRKKIAQTTASKFEFLQLTQQLSKEARLRKKNNQKVYVIMQPCCDCFSRLTHCRLVVSNGLSIIAEQCFTMFCKINHYAPRTATSASAIAFLKRTSTSSHSA